MKFPRKRRRFNAKEYAEYRRQVQLLMKKGVIALPTRDFNAEGDMYSALY